MRQIELADGNRSTQVRYANEENRIDIHGEHILGISHIMRAVEYYRQIEAADGVIARVPTWNPIIQEDNHTVDNDNGAARAALREFGYNQDFIIGPPDSKDEQPTNDTPTAPTEPPAEQDEGRQLELD